MTDIFAALIEISRKTQKEARIKFKGLGTLHLFKNRELAFLYEDDSVAIDLSAISGQKASHDLFLARQKEREDLSFIDSASAVLSRGGGNTFSVKSSALRSMSHVGSVPSRMTQDSKSMRYSSTSSVMTGHSSSKVLNPLKKDLVWKRYIRKNAELAKERESARLNNGVAIPFKGYGTVQVKKEHIKDIPSDMNLSIHRNAPT